MLFLGNFWHFYRPATLWVDIANMNYGRVRLTLSAGVFSNKPCADIRHAKDMNTDEIKYVLNAIKAMESIPSRIALEYSVPV